MGQTTMPHSCWTLTEITSKRSSGGMIVLLRVPSANQIPWRMLTLFTIIGSVLTPCLAEEHSEVVGFGVVFPIDKYNVAACGNENSDSGIYNNQLLLECDGCGGILPSPHLRSILHAAQIEKSKNGGCEVAAREKYLFKSDSEIINKDVNLSRIRGLDDGICEEKRWRVVSAIYTSCVKSKECQPELHVVAQPLSYQDFGWFFHDAAIHISYRVNGREFEEEIVTIAARNGGSKNLTQESIDRSSRSCGSQLSNDLQSMIRKFSNPSLISEVTWMISSRSGQHWTFGKLASTTNGKLVSARIDNDRYFQNFSKPMFLQGLCGVTPSNDPWQMSLFGCSGAPANQSIALAHLDQLTDVRVNPRNSGSCVSCHFSAQLRKLHSNGVIFDGNGIEIMGREGVLLGNMRQLGYDYTGDRSISKRSEQLMKSLLEAPNGHL
ncbi:hypothetical protein TRE132_08750 [Pseudomonas chlororaphis subsp. aurantiaca]|nr:hypothetical protein TRE132_08750 [Pseudomonas chlororaphis subsp. aurantiaca]